MAYNNHVVHQQGGFRGMHRRIVGARDRIFRQAVLLQECSRLERFLGPPPFGLDLVLPHGAVTRSRSTTSRNADACLRRCSHSATV